MQDTNPLSKLVCETIQQVESGPVEDVQIASKPLRGGLEASSVNVVAVRYRDVANRQKMVRLVAKQLSGRATREGPIYQRLVAAHARDLAPKFVAVKQTDDAASLLLIEAIRRTRSWPWHSVSAGQDLLAELAAFHDAAEEKADLVPDWNYEMELFSVAEQTQAALDACRIEPDLYDLARSAPSLKRIVSALPAIRSQLLAERPFGCRPIHGDLHPGNVLMRRRSGRETPILLDWGRARVASPLEDVSSWLQSVSFWEPQGRRSHDTLLRSYLSALGMDQRLTSSLRAVYWMAAASNVLSGALLHHLRATARRDRPNGSAAHLAAQDALRIIRRADAWWS